VQLIEPTPVKDLKGTQIAVLVKLFIQMGETRMEDDKETSQFIFTAAILINIFSFMNVQFNFTH
jgi:hypothetical protein